MSIAGMDGLVAASTVAGRALLSFPLATDSCTYVVRMLVPLDAAFAFRFGWPMMWPSNLRTRTGPRGEGKEEGLRAG